MLVPRDAMVSKAVVLWPLGVGLGSRADVYAGGCLDAYISLCATYTYLPWAFKDG